MVGAAGRVQAHVCPVSEIARVPNGNSVRSTVLGGITAGTGESGQVELVPLLIGDMQTGSEGVDAVVAGLVVIAVAQIRLLGLVDI